jgi:hypothetical protein
MSHELFYTSAPKGLQPGSRGFCTVAATRGMPGALLEKLEALSGYRPLFPPHDAKAALNPVVHAHLRINAGAKTYHVLSRIGTAGLDYTERTNKFAHHVVLEGNDLPPAGPAWLLSQPGFMETQWDGEVKYLPAGRIPPKGNAVPAVCRTWGEVTGDPGWGGVVAEAFQHDPNRLVYLLFEPGMDPLPLVAEALALLPAEQCWEATFSTYFTGLPQGTQCVWRCVPRGSTEAKAARKFPNALILDLGVNLGQARGSAFVARARGQTAALANDVPGNGAEGEDFPQIEAGARRPQLQSKTAAAVTAARPSGDFLPPPLPSAGRSGKGALRSWFLGSVAGLVVGVLVSAGLIGVAFVTGVLRMPDDADPTDHSANRPREAVVAKPGNADTEAVKEQLDRLNKELAQKVNENQQLKEDLKKAGDQAAALGTLKELVTKAMAASKETHPKPVEPPKRDPPGPTAQLQDLLKASQNGGSDKTKVAEQLTKLDTQVYGWVRELDKVRAAFAPKTVPNYYRLPTIINLKENEIPLPKEFRDRDQKKDWQLRLLGLDRLQQKREPNRLVVVRVTVKDKDKKPEEKRIAHFKHEGNQLMFQWDDDRDEDARRRVRNAVLEITRDKEPPYLVGLMRVESDPRAPFPLVVDFSKDLASFRTLERNKEEHLDHEIFLATARCELSHQMRVLRALPDTGKLEWNGRVQVRLAKVDDKPGEYRLTAQWLGDPKDKPARFLIHSLVAYTIVEGQRVEVWHLGDSDKKK